MVAMCGYICIYPYKSRAHINFWAQINTGVQHSNVHKCLCKMWKGLIYMPGQKLFIGNKHPGFYMDKYGIYIYSVPADIIYVTVTIIVSA